MASKKKDTSGVVSKVQNVVGKVGLIKVAQGTLHFKVKVIDYKKAYGKDRYYVEPVAGVGTAWVEEVEEVVEV